MSTLLVDMLSKKINSDEVILPCLFLGNNTEILNNHVQNIALELVKKFDIPKQYIYTMENNAEKIKIGEMKNFLKLSHSNPGYPFQIFIIENIGRFTLASGNSCLKFFEEPGKNNIIFLTNRSESGILETILSRVQAISTEQKGVQKKNEFYYNLLKDYDIKKSNEIFSYFFKSKIEKDDYLIFLENILLYATDNLKWIGYMDELQKDIFAIQNNNVNPRYIVDKYLLKLQS